MFYTFAHTHMIFQPFLGAAAMAQQHVLSAIVIATSIVCYYNSCYCGFVFDDISAIKDNRDLRPHTPLKNVFLNDFWGTPMHKVNTHYVLPDIHEEV